MSERHDETRRSFLLVAAAITSGLAGCGGGGEPTPTPTEPPTEPEPDDGEGVPDGYATATAIGGNRRNPEALSTKEAVQYQSEPSDGEQCSNCIFYIPDQNGDGLGACAIVEGTIEPEGWCASYSPQG